MSCLFDCASLQHQRSMFYVAHIEDFASFITLSDPDKVRFLLKEGMMKHFGNYLEEIFRKGRNILYRTYV